MHKPAYTLVFISSRARVIQLRLRTGLFWAVAALAATLIAAGAFAIWHAAVLQSEVQGYQTLRMAHLRQRVQLRKDADEIQQYTREIRHVRGLDRRLQLIANVNTNRPALSTYGIGGSEENVSPPPDWLTSIDADLAAPQHPAVAERLSRLGKHLRALKTLARREDVNLASLQIRLESQREHIEHTPYRWPLKGFISSPFGPRLDPFTGRPSFHPGIDIVAPVGTVVRAPADGIVTFADKDPTFGNMLVIDHGYGVITRYGHLSAFLVHAGERVKRGEPVARVGDTGRSTGPHLHYEIRVHDLAVNPLRYLIK